MERALLDVEHNNQFKNIQNDEAKLKHLQQEHQMRIETFSMHTEQVIWNYERWFYVKCYGIVKSHINSFQFNKLVHVRN